MAYTLEVTAADRDWDFPAPQQGEADTAEEVALFRKQVGGAIFDKIEKAKLVSSGGNANIKVGLDDEGRPIVVASVPADSTFMVDAYLQKRKTDGKPGGMTRYVTTQHYHPTPAYVPEADHAEKADKLTLGFKIKIDGAADTFIDGSKDVTLPAAAKKHTHVMSEITNLYRIFYGTADPSRAALPANLRDGDLYIKYID